MTDYHVKARSEALIVAGRQQHLIIGLGPRGRPRLGAAIGLQRGGNGAPLGRAVSRDIVRIDMDLRRGRATLCGASAPLLTYLRQRPSPGRCFGHEPLDRADLDQLAQLEGLADAAAMARSLERERGSAWLSGWLIWWGDSFRPAADGQGALDLRRAS